MPSMTDVRHAPFCTLEFDADSGAHPESGMTMCAGPVVELTPTAFAYLVTAPGEPVGLYVESMGELDGAALDAVIAKLTELRAAVTA